MEKTISLALPGDMRLTKSACADAALAIETKMADDGRSLLDNIALGEGLVQIGKAVSDRARAVVVEQLAAGDQLAKEHPSGTFGYVEGPTTWHYDDDELRQIEAEIKANAAAQAEAVVKLKAEQAQLETRLAARQQYLVANGLANRAGQGKASIRFTMAKGGGK